MDAKERFFRMLFMGSHEIVESEMEKYAESLPFSVSRPLAAVYLVLGNGDLFANGETLEQITACISSRGEAPYTDVFCFGDENANIYLLVPYEEKSIGKYCTRLAREIETKFRVQAFFGVGKAAESYCALRESARCAREMAKYRFYAKQKYALYTQSAELIRNNVRTTEKYDAVMDAFVFGDIPKMSIALDELAETIRKHPSVSRMSIKRSMIEATVRILNVASFSDVDVEQVLDGVDPYAYIISQQRTESIIAWILELAAKLLDCIRQSNHSSENSAVDKAISYMDAHITDPALSLNEICEYVGLSNAYFSQLFKNSIGIGVNEYITNNRLLVAKKMLSEGKMKVEEVAYASGFSNFGYFTSVFKKRVGVTPGKYKLGMK